LNEPAAASPPDAGTALLRMLRGHRFEGFERSFKMVGGEVLTDRFLAGIHKADLSPPALMSLCQQMGMPEDLIPVLRQGAQDANAFHFGYEASAKTGLYKVYIEFASRLGAVHSSGSARQPIVLHLAYKWDVLDPGRATVARYEYHPGLLPGGIIGRLAALHEGVSGGAVCHRVKAIVELAAGRTPEPLMYLEVSEDNNPRASFDLKLHDACLAIGEIESSLHVLGGHLGIAADRLRPVLDPIRDKRVSHLSGGINREGREFLTVYYPAEAH
jgi:hypothetical protein